MQQPEIHTIRSLNADFEAGRSQPLRVLEQSLAAAMQYPAVFTCLTAERARQAAQEAAARLQAGRRLGALDGIPISWKDLFDQAGETTRAGSMTTVSAAPKRYSSMAVGLLEQAGAVSLGRTNLTEFALSGLGLNPHYGTPANVWSGSEALAPGGSSSGAAVSVAAGMVACAMGTDTSGSIRIPAALNGLAGFKPSSTRLSRIGVWTLSPTLDSIGPLAHTVADICTVMRAFAVDAEPAAGYLKAVVPAGLYSEDAEPQIAAAFEHSIARLQQAGVCIERRPLAALDALPDLFAEYGTLVGIEACWMHQEALAQAEIMDARVVARLRSNQVFPPENLSALLAARSRLQHLMRQELQGALLLMPTTAIDAPPLARLEADRDYFDACNVKMLRNTMASSFLDMPSLTLPTGLNRNGLPAALQLAAPSGCDEAVLAAGQAMARLLTGDAALNALRHPAH